MLKIRLARKKEAYDIATINVLGWKTTYRGLLPDELLDNLSVTEKRIENFTNAILNCPIFFVAENEAGIIGYLNGGKPRTTEFPYPYEIYGFYIHPDFQRKGVGTALINTFKEKIKGKSFCVCLLKGNKKALNFYQKMGGIRYPKFDGDGSAYKYTFREEFLGFKGEND